MLEGHWPRLLITFAKAQGTKKRSRSGLSKTCSCANALIFPIVKKQLLALNMGFLTRGNMIIEKNLPVGLGWEQLVVDFYSDV